MENGFDRKLADKLSSLELNDPSNISDSDSLFQVMKAVEAAEATIKQQVMILIIDILNLSGR